MDIRWAIPISAAALALSGGCKQRDVEPGATRTTAATPETERSRTTVTEQAPSVTPVVASEDKEFISKAAKGGMVEVTLGSEAKRKATSADVKTFADRLVTEHGKANDELKQLAAKKGLTLPTAVDEEHKEKIDKLTKLSGTKFDKEFADFMVSDHEDDVKEFQKASRDAKDPELRAWAAKRVPVLEEHLKMAKDVKAKTK